MPSHRLITKVVAAGAAAVAAAALVGCSHPNTASTSATTPLRLGYLTRITHASALVGIADGLFAQKLGPTVNLTTQPFSQGTEEVTALLSGQLDAAYV
ncbi:aliphatic sulfonate ABC transporter substrate-binding protein, partial [Mycobacterium sp. CBMA361]|nr:aliphatic sulfonate ABC transporter substrate-binding protein [Mycolicibacterium sp. CBMA 361]